MLPLHPLASDTDVDSELVSEAQAKAALLLGRLDGALQGLEASENRLFCAALIRETLISALVEAGYGDGPHCFELWFSGLERGPEPSLRATISAAGLTRAILTELSVHRWTPLAEIAQQIQRAGRFPSDTGMEYEQTPEEILLRAHDHVKSAAIPASLPFSSLSRLLARLSADPAFAPVERSALPLRTIADAVGIQPRHGPELWAVPLFLGELLAATGSWMTALPCPNGVSAEVLHSHLWPNERALLGARGLEGMAQRLLTILEEARRNARFLRTRLLHLRSSARAPRVWELAISFSPLSLDQVIDSFGVSRRGAYSIRSALEADGLVSVLNYKGRVRLEARSHSVELGRSMPPAPISPVPALSEVDAALENLDHLLKRYESRVRG